MILGVCHAYHKSIMISMPKIDCHYYCIMSHENIRLVTSDHSIKTDNNIDEK